MVTAEGTIIGIPDTYYYAFNFPINGGIQQPAVVNEQAEITAVKFSNLGGNNDAVAVTIYNSGPNPITISSGMLNGKATTILSNNSAVDAGSTQTFTLQASTLEQGSKYQIVLISSQNNGFVYSSIYDSS